MPDGVTLPSLTISHLAEAPCPPTAANATWPNVLLTRVGDLAAQLGPGAWAKRIIADERQLVTLISSPPGTGNRPHWHRDFDEWWVVLGGRLEWELTGGTKLEAAKDDIVWVPRGTVHHIRTAARSAPSGSPWPCRPPLTTSAPASNAVSPTTARGSGARSARSAG